MFAANAESLLRVWENHQHKRPVQRALAALAAASCGPDTPDWARLPVGVRDNGLMALQEHLFGGALHTATTCPQCKQRLQSEFTVQDLRTGAAPPHGLRLQQQGYDIEYRLPTSEDLLQIAHGDTAGRSAQLLARCVHRAQRRGADVDVQAFPEAVVSAVAAEMARQDPGADVRVALECPACRAAWQMPFDIVSYFWGELDDWAQRVLADVHALAHAYGWSERAILALSPMRRRLYLDMVCA